jgi:hypothetical protein
MILDRLHWLGNPRLSITEVPRLWERATVRRLPGRKNRPVNGQFATYGRAHSSLLEVCDTHVIVVKMAGPIRQPIDIPALQRYIEQNVPQIKTPLEVKQVGNTL